MHSKIGSQLTIANCVWLASLLRSESGTTVTVSGSFSNLASGESQGVGWTVLLRP
jgi:hypothetical protein